MRPDRTGRWVFLTLAGVYLVTFGGHFYSGDGIEMARTAESIVLRGELALPVQEGERGWGYAGTDGRRYAPYPLGQSLIEAPFIAAASAATAPLPLEARLKDRMRHAATVSVNLFVSAGVGLLLYWFARRLGEDSRLAAGLALMCGLGTMLWVYARHDFADPLTALTLLAAALLLRRHGDTGRRADIVLAGLCLGFSLFTKYQMVIYCPVLWLYLLLLKRERGDDLLGDLRGLVRDTLLLAGPVVLFGLGDLAVNHAKFGSLVATGYEQESSPWGGLAHVPAGLHGFLMSPGKSIFLYNPLLLLWPFSIPAFHRAHRSENILTLSATVVTLLFFAPLYWWHGDWAWGPRYLLPLIPLMVLSLAPLARAARGSLGLKRAFAALLLAAVLVNGLGMTVNFFFYLRSLRSMGMMHDDWNFIPGLSPVAFHAHVVWSNVHEALLGTPVDYTYRAWSDGKFEEHTIPMAEYSWEGKIPDYFFFKPYDTRLERLGLGAAGAAFVALTLLAALRLRRELG